MMQPHRLKHVPLFTPVAIPLDVPSDDRTAVRRRNSVLANVRRKSLAGAGVRPSCLCGTVVYQGHSHPNLAVCARSAHCF